MSRLLIRNGRVMDPASGYDAVGDVLLDRGVIAAIGDGIDAGGAEEFDISGNAANFLQRTAGRNYSLSEQAELMNERHPLGARNLDQLDLEGTHYEAENSVGLW